MATSISFPIDPSIDDEYTYGDVTYVWSGIRWYAKGSAEVKASDVSLLDANENLAADNVEIAIEELAERASGGAIFTVETLAMPITGWESDGTLTDFQTVLVTITKPYEVNDVARIDPLLSSISDRTAWHNLELIRADRVSDTSIRLYAVSNNATAFNFELKIFKSS